MTILDTAIRQTLTYSDHFNFPLTLPELHARLISVSCNVTRLQAALTVLCKKKIIQTKDGYYYLPGRKSVITSRHKGEKNAQLLRAQAIRIAAKLCDVPGVMAIYLTGSVAIGNSGPGDDIDLMVIAEDGKLWQTRLLLTTYVTTMGLRRTPSSNNYAGKLCLNLYLTPRAFAVPSNKQSLYTAYELIQAVPLCDQSNTRRDLLHANRWIHDYLPNYPVPKRVVPSRSEGATPTSHYSVIESLCFYLQYYYMKNKITREYITRDAAFFHPHNPGKKVLRRLYGNLSS